MENVFEFGKKPKPAPTPNNTHAFPSLAVAMTKSLGIALTSEDAVTLYAKLQEIASQVALDEREACAKVADRFIGADPIAAAIRARGEA